MLDIESVREGSAVADPEVKILDFQMIHALLGGRVATIDGTVACHRPRTHTVPFKLRRGSIALRAADLKGRQKSL